MQNILNCEEEKKMNGTKILNLVNIDLCANGTLSSSIIIFLEIKNQ